MLARGPRPPTPPVHARASPPAPILLPALGFMAAIVWSEATGVCPTLVTVGWLAIGGGGVAGLVALFRAPIRLTTSIGLMCLCLAAFGLGLLRHQHLITPRGPRIADVLADEPILTRLTGQIVSAPIARPAEKYNVFLPHDPVPRVNFILEVETLDTTAPPTPLAGRIRVGIDDPPAGAGSTPPDASDPLPTLRLGDRVQLTGKLYRPYGPRNPGEPDWSRWYRAEGLDAGLSVDGPQHVNTRPHGEWAGGGWPRLQSFLRARSRAILLEPYANLESDSRARLLDAMILGQRTSADRDINTAFQRAGGMHFLAVSGFNVNILAVFTWWLLCRVLRQGRTVGAVGAVVAILLFAMVTELNAPILRAVIAGLLAALATLLRRPLSHLNWLALSAFLILLINPLDLFRAGFQLTFLQVLCLLTLIPRGPHQLLIPAAGKPLRPEAATLPQFAWRTAYEGMLSLAMAGVFAWFVSFPLVWWHFGQIAPWGWLGATLLSPLVLAVTLLGYITLLLGAIATPLGLLPGSLLFACTRLLLWAAGLFAHLPGALIPADPPPAWLVVLTYAALVLAIVSRRLRPPPRIEEVDPLATRVAWHAHPIARFGLLVAALTVVWGIALALRPAPRGPGYALHVLSVGNGSAAILATPAGHAALLDAGTDTDSDAGQTIGRALRALHLAEPADILISHPNFDHYSGLPTLLADRPHATWRSTAYFAASPTLRALTPRLPPASPAPGVLVAGQHVQLDDAELEILWPPESYAPAKANDASLVVRVRVGTHTILVPGDIERGAIEGLLDLDRRGTIRLAADVLVAPHHGSVVPRATADFLAAVSPHTIVISARTARPRFETLARDVLPGCQLLRTGQVGAITIRVRPANTAPDGGIAIETPFAPQ